MEAVKKGHIGQQWCIATALHLENCKACRDWITDAVLKIHASQAGSVKSAKKAKASRKNGKLGGRPRKQ